MYDSVSNYDAKQYYYSLDDKLDYTVTKCKNVIRSLCFGSIVQSVIQYSDPFSKTPQDIKSIKCKDTM
jgi:hypothetical protein